MAPSVSEGREWVGCGWWPERGSMVWRELTRDLDQMRPEDGVEVAGGTRFGNGIPMDLTGEEGGWGAGGGERRQRVGEVRVRKRSPGRKFSANLSRNEVL